MTDFTSPTTTPQQPWPRASVDAQRWPLQGGKPKAKATTPAKPKTAKATHESSEAKPAIGQNAYDRRHENAAQAAAVISVLRALAQEDQTASIDKATHVELLSLIERLVCEID